MPQPRRTRHTALSVEDALKKLRQGRADIESREGVKPHEERRTIILKQAGPQFMEYAKAHPSQTAIFGARGTPRDLPNKVASILEWCQCTADETPVVVVSVSERAVK